MPSAYQELTLWATKMQTWRTGARGCETNFGQLHRCAHRRASLQRSMQHSRAGTGAEPTQQHPTPPGPGAAPRSSSWGGADRQPIGVGLSQCHWKPKTNSHRRSTDTDTAGGRTKSCLQPRSRTFPTARSAAQRTARTKGHGAAGAPPPHPTPPSPLCDRRYTWTVAALSPNGAAGRTAAAPHRTAPPYAAPHRPCGHAVLPRSGDLPQQRGEIASCRSSDFEFFLLLMSNA